LSGIAAQFNGPKSLFLRSPQPSFEFKHGREKRAVALLAAEDLPMGSLSIWHWMVVIVVVLLLFGRGKISELMGDVAGGIKAFKKGMAEDDKPTETKSEPKTIDHQGTAGAAPKAETKSAESIRS
jgi:sec-independent protein translocase protein TatA